MNILILGDCQSNGNNLLVPEIVPTETTIPYGLLHKNKFYKELRKWYLNELKASKQKRLLIDTMKNIENIDKDLVQYLKKKQLEKAWPTYLDVNHTVTNLSFHDRTAIGYLRSLHRYLESNKKPDKILVTDHTPTHQVFRLYPRSKYYEVSYDPGDLFVFNNRISLDEDIQLQIYQKSKSLYEKNSNHIIKRSLKLFGWFLKYLERNGFEYQVIFFHNIFKNSFTSSKSIDCTHFYQQYFTEKGEIPLIKANLQNNIAQHIQKSLK